jgi:hypothetical protein
MPDRDSTLPAKPRDARGRSLRDGDLRRYRRPQRRKPPRFTTRLGSNCCRGNLPWWELAQLHDHRWARKKFPRIKKFATGPVDPDYGVFVRRLHYIPEF